jgi:hypothetical protein
MGHTPERFFCDFCTNELKRSDKRVTIEVPLTNAERRQVADEWDRSGVVSPMSIFGGLMPTLAMVNKSYTVVSCLPCFNTILPDAVALRKTKVAEAVAEMLAERARRQQADAEEVDVER